MPQFLRRASRLQVGDQICTGGLFDRYHIATREPCHLDGFDRIKLTFPHREALYLASDDLLEVTYLAAPRGDPPPQPRLGAIAVARIPLPFDRAGETDKTEIHPGEIGVCYYVAHHPGLGVHFYFIFERGAYTGYTDDNTAGDYLLLTDEHSPQLANYRHGGDDILERDYRKGVFQPAFDLALTEDGRRPKRPPSVFDS